MAGLALEAADPDWARPPIIHPCPFPPYSTSTAGPNYLSKTVLFAPTKWAVSNRLVRCLNQLKGSE